MGFSSETWEEFCALNHGVEIKKVETAHDGAVHALFVDGVEVYRDGLYSSHEPEDMCLSRDLAVFVQAVRDLAVQRDALRFPNGAVVMTPTEYNDMLDDFDEKLCALRERAEAAEAKIVVLEAKAVENSFALEVANDAAREADRTTWK
jgi:hypothetical protein